MESHEFDFPFYSYDDFLKLNYSSDDYLKSGISHRMNTKKLSVQEPLDFFCWCFFKRIALQNNLLDS